MQNQLLMSFGYETVKKYYSNCPNLIGSSIGEIGKRF